MEHTVSEKSWAEQQLDQIVDGLTQVDAEIFDADLGERFSCIVGQRYLIDVICIANPNFTTTVVLDIYDRPYSYNIHDDFSGDNTLHPKTHLGTYAVASLGDALGRIAKAVTDHTDEEV